MPDQIEKPQQKCCGFFVLGAVSRAHSINAIRFDRPHGCLHAICAVLVYSVYRIPFRFARLP